MDSVVTTVALVTGVPAAMTALMLTLARLEASLIAAPARVND